MRKHMWFISVLVVMVLVLAACGGGGATAPAAAPTTAAKPAAPPASGGAAASGKVLKYIGAANPQQWELDLVANFEKQPGGVKVEFIKGPDSASERLAQYLQFLAAQSTDIDVYQIDVIWPGILAEHMIDLKAGIPADEISKHFKAIVDNNTVGGKLVGLPRFTDAGLLYYRKDLLQKYGYNAPPTTWKELEDMATKIQAGEKPTNDAFWGFVWQGDRYEGLTCDALEWQVSNGGGFIIEPDGKISINNPQAAAAFDRARSWVGKISPPGVTTYKEEDSRGVWQAGNAAFMRNWPYAFARGQEADSKIKDKFDVVPLPKGDGPNARNADTLGGWQLAVSKYSRNQPEAIAFVRYLAGAIGQKESATKGSLLPTIGDMYKDTDVLKAAPFFGSLFPVFSGGAVARPSTVTADRYNEVSVAYHTQVHRVLTGEIKGADAVAQIEKDLQRIMK